MNAYNWPVRMVEFLDEKTGKHSNYGWLMFSAYDNDYTRPGSPRIVVNVKVGVQPEGRTDITDCTMERVRVGGINYTYNGEIKKDPSGRWISQGASIYRHSKDEDDRRVTMDGVTDKARSVVHYQICYVADQINSGWYSSELTEVMYVYNLRRRAALLDQVRRLKEQIAQLDKVLENDNATDKIGS